MERYSDYSGSKRKILMQAEESKVSKLDISRLLDGFASPGSGVSGAPRNCSQVTTNPRIGQGWGRSIRAIR